MAVLNMWTWCQQLLGTDPSKASKRVFRCTDFAHKQETTGSNSFECSAEKSLYIGNQDFTHRIYLPSQQKLVLTKHGVFDEYHFPLFSRQSRSVYIDEGHVVRQ